MRGSGFNPTVSGSSCWIEIQPTGNKRVGRVLTRQFVVQPVGLKSNPRKTERRSGFNPTARATYHVGKNCSLQIMTIFDPSAKVMSYFDDTEFEGNIITIL